MSRLDIDTARLRRVLEELHEMTGMPPEHREESHATPGASLLCAAFCIALDLDGTERTLGVLLNLANRLRGEGRS